MPELVHFDLLFCHNFKNRNEQQKKRKIFAKSLFRAQFLNSLRHLKIIHEHADKASWIRASLLYVSFLQLHCVAQC